MLQMWASLIIFVFYRSSYSSNLTLAWSTTKLLKGVVVARAAGEEVVPVATTVS